MSRVYFGTDGIRGRVGKSPITPDFTLKLGWAVGKILAENGAKQVIIGKDTRISGYMLESALEAGFAAAGIATTFTGPMPTPAIAYLTRTFSADMGVVISASHNPFYDNGIKFFSTRGEKLSDEFELKIEETLTQPLVCIESEKLGKATRIKDAAGRYIEFCKSTFDQSLTLSGLKIVVDCANGATYHIAPNVLKELGAEVIAIGCDPNGMNINEKCGATAPAQLIEKVLAEKADLGFALDGDGDRLLMIDHLGNILDGDKLIFIIAREALRQGKLKGGVIGTLMSNMGLEIAFKHLGIPFQRANVGDRHVLEKMLESNWRFGAENSGHILVLDKTTTGDGIVAGLQILATMARNKISLFDLSQGITMLPQILINVRYDPKNDPLNRELVQEKIKEVESILDQKGRVLIRKSGTEPLIRVMVEGEDRVQVEKLAQEIASLMS